MVNGLGILGWGVGGIEAEAAMLGQPIAMLIPDVIGFRLTGKLPEGATATDLVLTVTQMLRRKGVVGKFVEFFGPGLDRTGPAGPRHHRQHGAGIWRHLRLLPGGQGRAGLSAPVRPRHAPHRAGGSLSEGAGHVPRAGRARSGVHRHAGTGSLHGAAQHGRAEAAAGPGAAEGCRRRFKADLTKGLGVPANEAGTSVKVEGKNYETDAWRRGDRGDHVVHQHVESVGAGGGRPGGPEGARQGVEAEAVGEDLAGARVAGGDRVSGQVRPDRGSRCASASRPVGYGCTTCIGNSGPLDDAIVDAIEDNRLVGAAVISGNRNFEGRVHANVRANYLASPPLVVAYSLLGKVTEDITTEPLGIGNDGQPVYLKRRLADQQGDRRRRSRVSLSRDQFLKRYGEVFKGPKQWQAIEVEGDSDTYRWSDGSTYVKNPPYFDGITMEPPPVGDVKGARILAELGDSITTDHISPAGSIRKMSPAGDYLLERQVTQPNFNSYGARRGNHEVMMRGTFANIRIRNEMLTNVEGGMTKHLPSGEEMPIYDAAMRYKKEGVPLVVFGGKEYGTGSSRDWAAKGTMLLGIKAVIVESFERIHRSNLVGMGVLPLTFKEGTRPQVARHHRRGDHRHHRPRQAITPRMELSLVIHRPDGKTDTVPVICRIDTVDEVAYYKHGGILQYVLRGMAKAA